MTMTEGDLQAIWVSLKLGVITTGLLLFIATPLAWWLARARASWLRDIIASLLSIPLVLPPTVLGFYLLLLMAPAGPLGQMVASLKLSPLVFSFPGLVIGSLIFSMPFVVQTLQNSFVAISQSHLDAASTLGASKLDRFITIVIRISWHGYLTAAVLGFAHTIGEFGVILMIGGSIPGETRVISMVIYEHVEALEYANAHALSALMLVFSFVVLLLIQRANPIRWQGRI